MKHANFFLVIILCVFLRATHTGQLVPLSSIKGQWSGKAPDGTEISYTFTKGLVGKYRITVAKPYTKIDVE
ncbi:hypothetical protein F1728_06495 [Gimesia benthica]|uniref:Uncharacterized protein n=1 Tax=Gimesia benthica TaxID=2608982 RepID=A0A6I6ABA7_9PLAN|nr:hypothetical protein [Gimesia benthica]QGQ22341.1 hypothetical protein F1728_06495 [Gimesia benthica]